jgi:diguanylate cyclase (GGDEF)-like protein
LELATTTVDTAVTVSIGVCCDSPQFYDESGRLLHEADAALYAAKRLGRNRVEVAAEFPVPV